MKPGEQPAHDNGSVRLDSQRPDFAVGAVFPVSQRHGRGRLERGVHTAITVQTKNPAIRQDASVRIVCGFKTSGHQNLAVLEHLNPVDPARRDVHLWQGIGEGLVERPIQLQPGHARHRHPVKHQEPAADDHAVIHLHRNRTNGPIRAESRVKRPVERTVRVQPGDVAASDAVEHPELTHHDDAAKRVHGDVVNDPVRAGAEVERLVHRTVEVDAHEVVVILAVVRGELAADEQEIALVQLDDVYRFIRPAAGVENPVHCAIGQQAGQPANRSVVEDGEIASNHHRAVRHQLNVPDGAVGPEANPVRHVHRAGRGVGRLIINNGHHRADVATQRRAAHHVVEADEKILVVLQRPVIGQADDELFAEIVWPELERPNRCLVVGKLADRDRRAVRRQVAHRLRAGLAVLPDDGDAQLAAVLVDKIVGLGQLDHAVRVVVHDGHNGLVRGAQDDANRIRQLHLKKLVQFHIVVIQQRDRNGAITDIAVLPRERAGHGGVIVVQRRSVIPHEGQHLVAHGHLAPAAGSPAHGHHRLATGFLHRICGAGQVDLPGLEIVVDDQQLGQGLLHHRGEARAAPRVGQAEGHKLIAFLEFIVHDPDVKGLLRLAGAKHEGALLNPVVGPLLCGVVASGVVHRHPAVDAVKALDRDAGAPAVLVHHELRLEKAEIAGAEIVIQYAQAGLSACQAKAKRDDLAVQVHNPLRVGQTQPQHLVALDIRIGHKLNLLRHPPQRAVTEHPAVAIKPKTGTQQARRRQVRLGSATRSIRIPKLHQVKISGRWTWKIRNRIVIRCFHVEAHITDRRPHDHLVHVNKIKVIGDVRIDEISQSPAPGDAL